MDEIRDPDKMWGDVPQPLTRAEKLAIHNELKRAFPGALQTYRQEARLRRAIQHARLVAQEPAPVKADETRALADAVRDAERSFRKADRARDRLHKTLKSLPAELARRLVERAIEREEKPVEFAEARAWHRRGDPLGLFVYQLRSRDVLKEIFSVVRPLKRVLGSKLGRPKKELLTNLTLTIALVYFQFAGIKRLGVYTSDENDPEGEGREFATKLLTIAFPEDCRKPPAGIILAAFSQAREHLRKDAKVSAD